MTDMQGGQGLAELMARIPLFENLTMDECRRLLAICKKASYPAGKTVYAVGSPGNEMFLLLSGAVSIQMPDGSEIAEITAVDTVGEMEICSAQRRVARVVASGPASGLTVGRAELEGLIRSEPHLGVKILKNIVEALAKKLAATNLRLTDNRKAS